MALPTNLANGDLITEAWVDAVVNELTDLPNRYAQIGVRMPIWFGPGTPGFGTGATLAACAITIPAQAFAGRLVIWSHVRWDNSVSGDGFQISVGDGSTLAYDEMRCPFAGPNSSNVVATVAMLAATPKTISLAINRVSGTGTATCAATSPTNRIDCLFVPT